MKIEIAKAIATRLDEISRLKKLRGEIQLLISSASLAEHGKPCDSDEDFERKRNAVEDEMYCLGLARSVSRSENGIGGRVGIPAHWSQTTVE